MLSETVADTLSTVNNDLYLTAQLCSQGAYNNPTPLVPFCDKIAMKFDLNHFDSAQADIVFKETHNLAHMFEDSGVSVGLASKNKKKKHAIIIRAPNLDGAIHPWRMESDARLIIDQESATLIFNPGRWNFTQSKHLVEVLSAFFLVFPPDGYIEYCGAPHNSYAEFMSAATVTRFDIAVDLPGVLLNDLVISHSKYRSGNSFNNEGKKETDYLYKTAKGNRLAVYDKKAERMSMLKGVTLSPEAAQEVTRVEARFFKQTKRPYDLQFLKENPFKGLSLASASATADAMGVFSGLRKFFTAALQHVPEDKRWDSFESEYSKKLRACLTANTLPVWNTEKIWGGWNLSCLGPALSLVQKLKAPTINKTLLTDLAKSLGQ